MHRLIFYAMFVLVLASAWLVASCAAPPTATPTTAPSAPPPSATPTTMPSATATKAPSPTPSPTAVPIKIVVEAENFSKEEGGQVVKTEGRPATSGNVCLTTWNNAGHALEWQIEIPETGDYQIVLRYAGGRAWNVYRELQVDGKVPGDAFKKITFAPTGGFGRNANEWKNLVISDSSNKPALVNLTKGKHTLRIVNLGGDGADGGGNLDLIGVLGKDVKPETLEIALGLPTPEPTKPLALPTADPSKIKVDVGTPIGFATLGSGTTGGKGGPVYVVSDKDTFKRAVADDEPRTVVVSGTITLDLGVQTMVGSNKTILGLPGAKLVQGGIRIENKKNIIVKNIIFEDAHDPNPTWPTTKASSDNITIDRGASNVWVDHCTFSDGPHVDNESQNHDGALDVSGGSYITVSYNHFFNHDKVNLVGSDDKNIQDRGQLKITWHHNLYDGTIQRHPRVRFAENHVFNNYYKNVQLYGIGIGVEAKIYSEANYFENVAEPWRFYDNADMPGYIKDVGSFLANSGKVPDRAAGIQWNPSSYYAYKADPAESVKDIVLKYAGAGKPDAPTAATLPVATPTARPAAVADPAKALAAKKQTTEVLTDSFEKGTLGEFPPDWNILEKDNHMTNKSGPRVADDAKSPDGKLAIRVTSNPTQDGQMNRDFAGLPQGRLFFYGMVPSKDAGFLSVELRDGGTRMFNLEMHPEGRFRFRDENGNLQETNVKFEYDKWYQFVMEWDATASIWNGYVVLDGKQTLLTPEKGVPFPAASKGKAPNRIQLRLNRAGDGPRVGYVDGFKLFKIE